MSGSPGASFQCASFESLGYYYLSVVVLIFDFRFTANSRKRKLRELYHYTALLNAGHPPREEDWTIRDQPDETEARFLDDNDITKLVPFLIHVFVIDRMLFEFILCCCD